MNVLGKFDGLRKPLGGKFYIEADVPLKSPGNIKEILIGPLAPASTEAMIAVLLKKSSVILDGIPIWRSTVNPWRLRLHQLGQFLKRIGQLIKRAVVDRQKPGVLGHT